MWPYLLKIYPYNATDSEISRIIQEKSKEYFDILGRWKELERLHYLNNDPTSTSMSIRMGGDNTSQVGVVDATRTATHHVINTNEGGIPDLIELNSDSETDDDVRVDTNVGGASDEGEVDSGCEDRPHTGTSNEGEELANQNTEKTEVTAHEEKFLEELLKIDKDIPRCDRDYRLNTLIMQ